MAGSSTRPTPAKAPLECDLAVIGGRVIDPETGFDGLATVAITGNTIVAVTNDRVSPRKTIDATGKIVAPGWIDVHSHAQSVAGGRLQAHDGVTTALDLESGMSNIAEVLNHESLTGRPINYGYSASWQQARMIEVGGLPTEANFTDVLQHLGNASWKQAASARTSDAMLDRIQKDIADGGVGVGVLMGYAPLVDPAEYVAVSRIAALSGVGTFTHARDLVEQVPDVVVDGAEEIVRAALETGVNAHYCHINSTSQWHVDRVLALIERCEGRVTTEAYPYGAASTGVSADFLAPERLHERGLTFASIVDPETGQRIASEQRLRRLRAEAPGQVVVVHFLEEWLTRDMQVLDRAFAFPRTVVGSDAMPLNWQAVATDPMAWPPPPGINLHPRAAGTFSRFIRRYVRELGAVSLIEAIGRCTLAPAQILEPFVLAMARKGRLQAGCDADLVIFDLDVVSDRATYRAGAIPSVGYALVMVNGVPVVIDDQLQLDAMPGRPVRSESAMPGYIR